MGQQSASKANRPGGAEHLPDPAVPKRIEVDGALRDYDDRLLSALEWSSGKTARQHAANTLSRLQTGPGVGKM
jgi:hypothetical protein